MKYFSPPILVVLLLIVSSIIAVGDYSFTLKWKAYNYDVWSVNWDYSYRRLAIAGPFDKIILAAPTSQATYTYSTGMEATAH